MATSSTLHHLGTIEARVNAALLALDGAGDAARSIEYGGPLPLMAYQRTQLTEAVALCRGAVLLLQTALGPVEDARKYVAQVEAANAAEAAGYRPEPDGGPMPASPLVASLQKIDKWITDEQIRGRLTTLDRSIRDEARAATATCPD